MKILVEKAVIEQALEALDMVTSCGYGSNTRERAMYQGSFTALQEVIDEPELNLNCKSVQKRLATSWGYVKAEQQEPVACERCEELAADKGTWYRMAERFAIRNEELKKALAQALNLIEGEWPEGDEIAQPVIDTMKATLANQPAPVRTKDLTDDEIKKLQHKIDLTAEWSYVNFARAVIAADREKNK